MAGHRRRRRAAGARVPPPAIGARSWRAASNRARRDVRLRSRGRRSPP